MPQISRESFKKCKKGVLMSFSVAQKVLNSHLVCGNAGANNEVALVIDQTLTQDATGTLAYLQFEAIGLARVKTQLSVSYVDHNTLQSDFKNADDHIYLQSVAQNKGVVFSRVGNGICHQLHLERFAAPGATLIGSDSHTPTAGAMGCIAIGCGGLDVALAMAGKPLRIVYPKIFGIKLVGKLDSWVNAKDVILEVLRQIGVKGGVGYILEYFGEGVQNLTVPQRATITNMGAETGATTSIFPSDEATQKFLKAQGREEDFVALKADSDVVYDKLLTIDLNKIEPMVALPHSPSNVKKVREVGKVAVSQVCIGSCTNSSFSDLSAVARILEGKTISEKLHLIINPGSRQVVKMLVDSGAYGTLIDSGARIYENSCGACIGMGGAPCSKGVSVRTYNRNFKGRSGTTDASVYLASPQVAAATAITGFLTDPRDLRIPFVPIKIPEKYPICDNMFIFPKASPSQIVRGPNIAPLPQFQALASTKKGEVLLKVDDDVTTDDIMPAGAKVLPFRSNIPKISEFVFENIDKDFVKRAKKAKGGIIVAGENYGQGSSREHAALAPRYLGVFAVVAKSFARIHLANLVNFGIVPLVFENPTNYQDLSCDDSIQIEFGNLTTKSIQMICDNASIALKNTLSSFDREILLAGGKLAWVKTGQASLPN